MPLGPGRRGATATWTAQPGGAAVDTQSVADPEGCDGIVSR